MKRLFLLFGFLLSATAVFAQGQSGYGGDGKAQDGASVSSLIRLYETPPGAATTALAGAGAGNVDNGAHLVKVTCYTPGGQTTGGTASNSTTVADKTTNGKIAISAIPTCSNIATGRKVYMTTAGGSTYYLLSNGTITDNTTTTLTANDADATLTASTVLPTSNTALDSRFTVGQNGSTTYGSLSTPINSIAATSTDGHVLSNSTAATVSVQSQYSPRLRFTAQGWKTNATAASEQVDWIVEAAPATGAADPIGYLYFRYQVNGGGYSDRLRLGPTSALFSSVDLSISSGNVVQFLGIGYIDTAASQDLNLRPGNTVVATKTVQLKNQAVTATSGGTTTLDLSNGNIRTVTMPAGNTTIAFSNVLTGDLHISITQDSVGGRSVTWPAAIKWVNATAPTLSAGANKRDQFFFQCDGTNCYEVSRALDVR